MKYLNIKLLKCRRSSYTINCLNLIYFLNDARYNIKLEHQKCITHKKVVRVMRILQFTSDIYFVSRWHFTFLTNW